MSATPSGDRVSTVFKPRLVSPTGIRFGSTVLTPDDFPELLRRLHTQMAVLRAIKSKLGRDGWDIPNGSTISPAMLNSACDPASTRLLDWTVYDLILDLADVDLNAAQDIRTLYRALEAIKPADLPAQPHAEDDRLNHLQWSLAAITTEADMMDHVRTLRTQKGWSLRRTEKEIRARHPKYWISNSTLSTWLNHTRLPTNRTGFKALIHTLLPNYLKAAGQKPISIYMQRYDELRAAAGIGAHIDSLAGDDQVDWEAHYRKSEKDRLAAVARIKALENVVAQQQHWIDTHRKEKTSLVCCIDSCKDTGPTTWIRAVRVPASDT